jgi:hypothetical protein
MQVKNAKFGIHLKYWGMRKIFLVLALALSSFASMSQNGAVVKAYIEGCKISDTLKIDDLIRIGEISVDNKEFSIVSFTLTFLDRGFLQEYKATSNKLTDEMKTALVGLKSKNMKSVKLLFENIIVRTPQNTKSNIGILIYKVKI